jgi:tetratricopeptide (TPR) repeat protein
MKRKFLFVLCSILVQLIPISAITLAGGTSKSAVSLFDETISLLSQTGGIASFDAPAALGQIGKLPSAEKVDAILDEVICNLHTVIRLDPNIRAAHYFLGIAYVRKMDREPGIATFYKALDVEPDREMTYILLCGLLWDAKRYEDALNVTSRLTIQIPQAKVTAAILTGKTYFEMGEFRKALSQGLGIIDLDSSRLEGRILVASSNYCLGNYEESAEQFKILESDPRIGSQIAEFKNEVKEKCGGRGHEGGSKKEKWLWSSGGWPLQRIKN